jgi:cell division protein FtsZ
MIEYPRASKHRPPNVRIAGIGGAGCRVLERLVEEHVEGASFVAMNSDAQLLAASSAPEKIQLGARGVGAGGDPDAGYVAADESASILRESLEGAELVFLCAGLGGGTGSGATPLIANIARQCGATVVSLVTLPFRFEGRRRQEQAQAALAQLGQQSQLVLCFENDRMGEMISDAAPAHQSFAMADTILTQAVRALISVVRGHGLLHVGLDELTTTLRRTDGRCLFGHGESDSDARATDALDRALRSPLMNRGQMLAEARDVVIHVAAGAELSVVELGALMEHAQRHVGENTRLHLGIANDSRLGRRLAVTVISSTGSDIVEPVQKQSRKLAPLPVPAYTPAPEQEQEPFNEIDEPAPYEEPVSAPVEGKKGRVEQMQFEPVNRGRFEKSEPTIVDGQDLDVPTFLRKGLRIR